VIEPHCRRSGTELHPTRRASLGQWVCEPFGDLSESGSGTFAKRRLAGAVASEAEIDAAFDTLRGVRASALLVQPDAFLIDKRIVAPAARDALPAMCQARELVVAGGLMSCGSSLAGMYRQMGVYPGKVLKGANPVEMPVLQPIKFEMAINLQTAKAFGLKPSDDLLSIADEVIE
jgi:putative tryptophan/tyrosine transport system substrate-binding protein